MQAGIFDGLLYLAVGLRVAHPTPEAGGRPGPLDGCREAAVLGRGSHSSRTIEGRGSDPLPDPTGKLLPPSGPASDRTCPLLTASLGGQKRSEAV